ncbi:MFS transporter [Streptomyces sp. NPDC008150]|uniref:MFS transporter n=1 Tax=Streptomyces sp. NPDC008150 TaxID=3364816 RepID=UPI0036EA0C19
MDTRVKPDRGAPSRGSGPGTVLVLAGTLTIMAGATVAPVIPDIRTAFKDTADVDLLARMITTTHALAIVLFAPLAGALSERIGRKRTLLLGMAAFALGGSSGAYLPDLVSILAGRVVLGIGVSLVMSSSIAMIGDLYEGTERQRLMGRQAAAGAFGGVVLLLGGGALAGLGWRSVFLVYLLAAVLAVPAWRFLPSRRPDAGPGTADGADGDTGAERSGAGRRAGRHRLPGAVVAALAAMTLGQVAFYSVPVQIPFLVEDHFHDSSVMSGAVIATQTFTTGVVALRFAFFRRLAGEYSLVAAAFTAIAAGYVVLFAAPHVAVLFVGMVVMGFGLGVLMPTLNNWVISKAPEDVRGRYSGYLTTALFLGQFLAPVLVQPVAQGLGIQPAFAVIAVGCAGIALAYAAGSVRGRRRGPSADDTPATAAAQPVRDTPRQQRDPRPS